MSFFFSPLLCIHIIASFNQCIIHSSCIRAMNIKSDLYIVYYPFQAGLSIDFIPMLCILIVRSSLKKVNYYLLSWTFWVPSGDPNKRILGTQNSIDNLVYHLNIGGGYSHTCCKLRLGILNSHTKEGVDLSSVYYWVKGKKVYVVNSDWLIPMRSNCQEPFFSVVKQ